MRLILYMLLTLMAAPVMAGNLADQGLDDPVVFGDSGGRGCYPVLGTLSHNKGEVLYWTGDRISCAAVKDGDPTRFYNETDPPPGCDDCTPPPPPPPPPPGCSNCPPPSEPTKGNNGYGNGDQDAPGGSEPNNGAENKGGNRDGGGPPGRNR